MQPSENFKFLRQVYPLEQELLCHAALWLLKSSLTAIAPDITHVVGQQAKSSLTESRGKQTDNYIFSNALTAVS
ncbi:hypothetical protein QCA50_020466 [Cerrena zonata]|uniref:Uncharacterized protein n=1 Tax=Cerrena zonata TaxID=2478898 RepID=A0AAW0F7R4_9APHY